MTELVKKWLTFAFFSAVLACSSGRKWVNQPQYRSSQDQGIRIYDPRENETPAHPAYGSSTIKGPDSASSDEFTVDSDGSSNEDERPILRLVGKKISSPPAPSDGQLLGVFRNTYYDFPSEFNYSGEKVPLMNRSCQPIRDVPRPFYEAVCVQGSGTLASGATVSFAKRDCSCAELCPRTGQRICFDQLDQKQFPWGRGAMGKPIVPLLSVAVDSDIIPLGTRLYIAEFDGVERSPGGPRHDGCFVAEDRGLKVRGQHVDVFSGNPSITAHLNGIIFSNQGVHVYVKTSRCDK